MNRSNRGQPPSPTKRQLEVLETFERVRLETGLPPTVRELADELGFSSTNSVSDHVAALERKGLIERLVRHRARALAVTDLGQAWLGRAA